MKKAEEKIKREDIKVHPDVKRSLQKEAGRLDVYDYQIAEEAIRRFLLETKSLPEDCGALPSSSLQDFDRALVADVIEMIQDSNGSYRASVADMVQAWKTQGIKQPTKRRAAAQLKAVPNAKARPA